MTDNIQDLEEVTELYSPEITQNELDALLSGPANVRNKANDPVWIVKNMSYYGAVVGGRCWSYSQAVSLQATAQKHYPGARLEIVKIR